MELNDGMKLGVAFLAAVAAGGINSVAGGGTMVSFPALVGLGLPAINANATSTLGIWPGSVGSVVGFWVELKRVERKRFYLLVPATCGGLVGAVLLRMTPAGVFDWIVPWLILFAVVLFIVQGPVRGYLERRLASQREACPAGPLPHWAWHTIMAYVLQFLVGIYGGYFGAGMSIMMLGVLGVLGMTDILEMNALTSLLSLGINGVAGILFAVAGLVQWPFVAVMAAGSLAGGYGAAGVARRIGKTAIRRFVIFVGAAIAAYMFWRVLAK